jgi:hypothetical protein
VQQHQRVEIVLRIFAVKSFLHLAAPLPHDLRTHSVNLKPAHHRSTRYCLRLVDDALSITLK